MAPKSVILALAAAQSALAYPWVAQMPGVDSSMLPARRSQPLEERQSPMCPFNARHEPAAPITDEYPYMGAINGREGSTEGGIPVPAPGDVAHEFRKPNPATDIRGPCPGLNVLANHNFIARDGITTYNELVDAQQNVYNTGYLLANVLAIAGVGLTGDIIGTSKMSIGCDATSRTAGPLSILASQPGLNGHNKFEADTSLTRNDFFLGENGDNFKFNATLFTNMIEACGGPDGLCNRQNLGMYRGQRYEESKRDNPNFFFGPGSLLLYGAASFLYELMPGSSHTASESTMMSFFGAGKDEQGNYFFNDEERLPENWRNRETSYSRDVVSEIVAMYLVDPKLFGGNIGANNFNGLNLSTYIVDGRLDPDLPFNALCLAYQAINFTPGQFGNVLNIPVRLINRLVRDLAPMAENLGCPLNPADGSLIPGS